MSLTFSELTAETPTDAFIALVTASTDDELRTAMREPEVRASVLAAIFEQMPARLRPDRARGIDAIVHWTVTGADDVPPTLWEVVIRDGACTVAEGFAAPKPSVSFEVADVAFLRMIAGATTGMKLMMLRKLRVRGDMMLAPRIESMFKTEPGAVTG